jgi:taurine dioxygenase
MTTPPTTLHHVPLGASIGSIVTGVDLRRLDDASVASLRTLLAERKVLFFPDQHLDQSSHVAAARRFGVPTEGHPAIPSIEGYPNIFEIDFQSERDVYANYGDVASRTQGLDWHTDVTFVARPPFASMLNALAMPPSGGDTQWSDQQAAFDALSPTMQRFLEGLRAVHDGRASFAAAFEAHGAGRWEGEDVEELEPVEHPVIRTIEETGAKVLFVNPGFTSHIVGLSPAESDALLAFLYRHSVRPEFTVRYHWTTGDVAFWDNRATQHSVVGDYGDQQRVIQRVTLQGDVPA